MRFPSALAFALLIALAYQAHSVPAPADTLPEEGVVI